MKSPKQWCAEWDIGSQSLVQEIQEDALQVRTENMAHAFARHLNKGQGSLDMVQREYDEACIDFACECVDWLREQGLRADVAYFDTPKHTKWRYHCSVLMEGWIHDLWQATPVYLVDYMKKIGAKAVDFNPGQDDEPVEPELKIPVGEVGKSPHFWSPPKKQ